MKSIRGPEDLAINGAPPAFGEPLHVGRPNLGDRDRLLAYTGEIYDRRWLTNNGQLVRELEQRLADRLGVRHCVAMCNGTIAMEIAIRALGLKGEVIVPSWTFIATAHALYWQGITPVFADIDPDTHNLDPEAVRRMITPRTTGIIGVHLWGRAAPVEALQSLADEFEIQLLFDAAHAFGCGYLGQTIGRFGACEVLSFHATKIFNTFEGGAVVTDDDDLAGAMRLMRNFGFSGYDNVIYPGTNGKMPEINAAMGLTNLDSLQSFIDQNRACYDQFKEALEDAVGLNLIQYYEAGTPNYQYIVVELDEELASSRDFILEILRAEKILARKYFWPGCHRMKPYCDLFPHAGLVLPETQNVAARNIVLPNGPTLPAGSIEVIARILKIAIRAAS